MMSPVERHARVRAICEQMCEQPLDAESMRELELLLLGDAAAQAIYLKYVHLDTQLGLEFGGRNLAAFRNQRATERVEPQRATARRVDDRFGSRRRLVAAAIAVACSLVIALWWWGQGEVPKRAGTVAYLSPDVRWLGQNASPMVGEVLMTGDYELATGLARLALDDGAMVRITGPCHWTVVDANRVRLADGVISAFVPRSAAGFSVDIPGATLVDRGTQFAVQVRHSGVSEVHVDEGQVDVTPENGDESQSLVGGDAVRFDSDSSQLASIEFDKSFFADRRELRITSHTGDGKVVATGKVDTREWPNHRILRVGMGGPARGRSGCAIIYFFELPRLMHPSDLEDASLELHYIGYQDPKPSTWGPKLKDIQVDLFVLGTRSEPVIRSSDYDDGAALDESVASPSAQATLIERDFVNVRSKPGVLPPSPAAHAALLRYLREQVYRSDGTPTGRYLAVRLSPDVKMPRGRYEIRGFVFSEAECGFPGDRPPQLTLRVAAAN